MKTTLPGITRSASQALQAIKTVKKLLETVLQKQKVPSSKWLHTNEIVDPTFIQFSQQKLTSLFVAIKISCWIIINAIEQFKLEHCRKNNKKRLLDNNIFNFNTSEPRK